jgi:hypothetical protein
VENTPASIAQYRRTREQDAEIAALRRENDRLKDPELPEYIRLWGAIAKGPGLTADQRIDLAMLHREYAEAWAADWRLCDEPLCLDMCEAFIEYVEGRALAAVAAESSPGPPAIVLAFRTRNERS